MHRPPGNPAVVPHYHNAKGQSLHKTCQDPCFALHPISLRNSLLHSDLHASSNFQTLHMPFCGLFYPPPGHVLLLGLINSYLSFLELHSHPIPMKPGKWCASLSQLVSPFIVLTCLISHLLGQLCEDREWVLFTLVSPLLCTGCGVEQDSMNIYWMNTIVHDTSKIY